MSVTLIISDESAGDPLASLVDLEDATPGGVPAPSTAGQDLYIRHTAEVNPITGCGFYITRYAGDGYLGLDADDDYDEAMTWGDSDKGFLISQDSGSTWTAFKAGEGDEDTPIPLTIGSGVSGDEIAVGAEVHVKVRWEVPSSIAPKTAARRSISLNMAYSATS